MKTKIQKSFLFSLIALTPISSGVSQTTPAANSAPNPPAISQSGTTIHLAVTSPRPLIAALDALQIKFNWSLNYEDPQFVSNLDLAEFTDPRSVLSHTGPMPHIPNGGSFSLDFPAGADSATPPDAEKTLHLIVDAYNQGKNPGQFELRKAGETFDVVGIAAHDNAGHISRQKAQLDFPVTLIKRERSASDTVDLICQNLTTMTRIKTTVGVLPRNVMKSRMVSIGGKKLPARELLASTLSATGRQINWRLLYDPDSKSYVLNLHSSR